jgi:two-component system, NtrC family, response regulator AtoC
LRSCIQGRNIYDSKCRASALNLREGISVSESQRFFPRSNSIPRVQETRAPAIPTPIEMIGACSRFLAFKTELMSAALCDREPVLLVGERGAGKEPAAQALHQWSPRCHGVFLPVSLPALSHDLIADELFGHERNSFTGAIDARPGSFVTADGGTLFLDEIADICPSTQAALLRVIEAREVKPIGGDTPRALDVRIVAATNRDLAKMITEGKFRADLYDRLSAFQIQVPPLRERREDIPALASHFCRQCCARSGCALGRPGSGQCQGRQKVECVCEEFYQRLQSYDWPGNVRELRSAVIRARALHPKALLDARHLAALPVKESRSGLDLTLESAVRRHIEEVSRLVGDNLSAVARELGIPRSTLRNLIKKLGIPDRIQTGRKE